MACGCQGRSGSPRDYRSTVEQPVRSNAAMAAAAQAGAGETYEVVTASGMPTGRRFTSLVAAGRYASAIGGSTKPVTR